MKQKGDILALFTVITAFILAYTFQIVQYRYLYSVNDNELSWILYILAPLPISCIVIGYVLKHQKEKHRLILFVGYFFLTLSLCWGSSCFISSQGVEYNSERITNAVNEVQIILPSDCKETTREIIDGHESKVKFNDKNQIDLFNNEIDTTKWADFSSLEDNTKLYSELKNKVSDIYNNYDYYIFYDIDTGTFNNTSLSDTDNYIFMAYDTDMGHLYILEFSKI